VRVNRAKLGLGECQPLTSIVSLYRERRNSAKLKLTRIADNLLTSFGFFGSTSRHAEKCSGHVKDFGLDFVFLLNAYARSPLCSASALAKIAAVVWKTP
jgi:hypothetical protein